jgi:hypothetical protein
MRTTDDPFADVAYDPETLAILTAVFDDAWADLIIPRMADARPKMLRYLLATRIMVAASRGERDPVKLKAIAMGMEAVPPA